MDPDERSNLLLGRCYALRTYAEISRLPKDEFTVAEIRGLTGLSSPDVSRELKKLAALELVTAISRRGDYRRNSSSFWRMIDALAEEWGYCR